VEDVTLKKSLIITRNRDAEEKLMKDVEGWEVGTWYGHPIYKVSLLFLFLLYSIGTCCLYPTLR
jgi:hypothetical protein